MYYIINQGFHDLILICLSVITNPLYLKHKTNPYMNIGIIGFGTMAENLILNLNSKHKTFAIYNRTVEKVERFIKTNPMNKAAKSIEDLTKLIQKPRVIMIFIPAGSIIDVILTELASFLDVDDVVIDLGNSCYKDTMRRSQDYEFLFVGCGISGGEMGARFGASLMPGGNYKAWEKIEALFMMIAATHNDNYCCKWLGPGGSGHLVKTIHNGIEYGNMAIISEIASLLPREKAGQLFKAWNADYDSFLLDISSIVLMNPKIDQIEDIAQNKGTGIWSSMASLKHQSCLNIITAAVYARIISKEKNKREILSKHSSNEPHDISTEDLQSCFELATLLSYIQGMILIKQVSDSYTWNLSLNDILEIWKNGSIIKSNQLNFLQEIEPEFETNDKFIQFYKKNIKGFRRTVAAASIAGVAIPTLSSALNYIHALCQNNGNGRTIQAMRDFFGAHKVRFIGDNSDVHVKWDE